MSTLSLEKILERALLQVKGMEKYNQDAQHAPVAMTLLTEEAQRLQIQKTLQNSLKAQLHQATQEADALAKTLEQQLVRNVNYFMGLWGKRDKRLEEIGGHALATRHRPKTPVGA